MIKGIFDALYLYDEDTVRMEIIVFTFTMGSFVGQLITDDVGVKSFCPLIPTDFSAFHAHEILKTFEIRSFFYEKWLLSHVLRVPKSCFFMQA